MSLRRLPYGANYLDQAEATELQAAFEEKILFRYTTERKSSGDLLEEFVRNKFKVTYALATPNCTQSLRLAILATRPKVGDKVYIPCMTFVAVAGAVLSCGLIPVLTDVDENYSLDPEKLPRNAERVIVAHMEGLVGPAPNDVPFVIEDAAQAMGAKHPDGVFAGCKGAAGVFSFHHAKVLTSGEGGLVVTNNDNIYQAIRAYHDHGSSRKHGEYPTWKADAFYGENMVAGELQTSVQLQQFHHLDKITAGLERGYSLLKGVISSNDKFDVLERKTNDQKISLRIRFKEKEQQLRAANVFHAKGLPFWNFGRYYLPDHPVLRDRQSIYADGFPWNLAGEDPLWDRAAFAATKDRIDRTLCLPVSPEQPADVQAKEAKAYLQALSLV